MISVFGGGSESGCFGNRSILDLRSPKMKDIINEKVKHRQWFRPFFQVSHEKMLKIGLKKM